MSSADILLLSAPATSPLKGWINQAVGTFPVGLASLGAVLVENNYPIIAKDLFHHQLDVRFLKKFIADVHPKIVGISAATETYTNALRIANLCKQVNSRIKIIMGGPHVSFTAEEVLQEDCVDLVVRGEAEYTMLELAGYYLRGLGSLGNIKGISYRHKNGIIHNPPRHFIKHLDELSFPARVLFEDDYTIKAGIITSRGCPAKCIFCSAAAISGGKYRPRSAESVVDEISFLLKKNLGPQIKFLDDTVTAKIKRLEVLLDYLEALNLEIYWAAESRVDVLNESILRRMGKMGCVSIQFGVESGSQKILDHICKKIRLDQVIQALEWAKKSIKHICCSFMIGHPYDTEETIRETIEFALKIQREYCSEVLFSITTPYPGTYMYQNAQKLGLKNLSRNFDEYNFLNPVFETEALSKQLLKNYQFDGMQQVLTQMPEKIKKHYRLQYQLWGADKTYA